MPSRSVIVSLDQRKLHAHVPLILFCGQLKDGLACTALRLRYHKQESTSEVCNFITQQGLKALNQAPFSSKDTSNDADEDQDSRTARDVVE